MSIRTTLTLDDDVAERVRIASRARGTSFRDTLNDLLRAGLLAAEKPIAPRTLAIQAFPMGRKTGLNYDDVESLLEHGEGDEHR